MTKKNNFAAFFDHTLLKPDATTNDIIKLCQEAKAHSFFSVCVNPSFVSMCAKELAGTSVAVCTVVGFPLGATTQQTKLFETENCLKMGATEIDMVINIGALKDGRKNDVIAEIKSIVEACRNRALVKVIVESGLLTEDELALAIDCVNEGGAEFIKTSTGFTSVGATIESVTKMKALGRDGLQIKASGGIRTARDAQTFIDLGVHRIGASRSVEILKELGGDT